MKKAFLSMIRFYQKKISAFVSATLPFLSYLLPVCRGGN